MKMDDDLLDKVGDYFVENDIHKKYNMTFQQFIRVYETGLVDI